MRNRGFTFVEVIGVLVVLGIISLITIPAIVKVMQNNRANLKDEQIRRIEDSARLWGSDNNTKLSTTQTVCISVSKLVEEGYIDKDQVKNPQNTSNVITGYVNIRFTSNKWKYQYNTNKAAGCKEY